MQTPFGLTPKQAATVAFVSTFVTVIGGLLLAFWFRRKNKKEMEYALIDYRNARNGNACCDTGYRF